MVESSCDADAARRDVMRGPAVVLVALLFIGSSATATQTVIVHGHPQTVRVYGARGGPTAIVSSGDGGWIHLAPHVAELLASRGWFVIGFDSRGYLSSVADANQVLSVADIPRDYDALVSLAGKNGVKPLLIGISEGAGLSAAAAVDPAVKREIGGVVAIGLGDSNELAWHMRDAIIYVTKGIPREPLFHATDVVGEVAPVPIAMLRSTGDEFVRPEESDRLIRAAREPKAAWTIPASDHRFSNNLKEFDAELFDAIAWIGSAPAHDASCCDRYNPAREEDHP
jgi:alpha-beta hydrolase superfamily lysophospholipase